MAKKSDKNAASEGKIGNNVHKAVAESLAKLLAATYVLQLKTQYYHWNVVGPHFAALHTLFGAQYDAIALAVDEVAERIRALGHIAPGTFREFLESSILSEDKTLPKRWEDMVKNLAAANEAVAGEARDSLPKIQKAGDEATADLLIRRIQEHDKAAWMLRSHLQ